jgi:hypothetical protein
VGVKPNGVRSREDMVVVLDTMPSLRNSPA